MSHFYSKLKNFNILELRPYKILISSKPGGLNIPIKDFGQSWRDGKAFNNMIHAIDPKLVDMEVVEQSTNRENLESAFNIAEKDLNIPRLLEPGGKSYRYSMI